MAAVQVTTRTIFEKVLSHFPQKELRLAFAYGSGVFQQEGHADVRNNMLDFIFAVDDPVEWHRQNRQQHPKHYSFLKYLGPKYLVRIQQNYGAGVYFNTLVKCEDRVIKYGVISTEALLNDLYDWETLYISGRLHKPVRTVLPVRDGSRVTTTGEQPGRMPGCSPVAVTLRESVHHRALATAIHTNLQSAVHASLLLLPETFTEEELFCTITGLSYRGDFRMTVGEDRNKVSNIVKPNLPQFRELYAAILDTDQHLHWNLTAASFEQSLSPMSRFHHLSLLPKMLQFGLVSQRNVDGHFRDTEEVLYGLAHDTDGSEIVETCVANIVKASAFSQSVKGIFTAGLSKSVKYSWSKLKKMWKSKKK